MATLALGGIGAGIGYLLPVAVMGPGGALLGAKIGMAIGALIDSAQTPTVPNQDLLYSGSSYGTAIPRVWGNCQVAGNVIWTAINSEGNSLGLRGGGGGSYGKGSTTPTYLTTIAVSICAGTITNPDGSQTCRNIQLQRVYADDEVVWDIANPDAMLGSNQLTFYPGTETQAQDPVITSFMGAAFTPAFRGMAYIVINEFVCRDFGNRIPNFRFDIQTDDVTVGEAFSDIALATGMTAGQFDVAAATMPLTGLKLDSRTGGDAATLGMLEAYAIDMADIDGVLTLVPRGAASEWTIEAVDLGASTGSQHDKNAQYEITRTLITELPKRFEVGFNDVENEFNAGLQRDTWRTATIANQKRLDVPLTLTNDDAFTIARRRLTETWLEQKRYAFSLPWTYLGIAASDILTFPANDGSVRLRVIRVSLAGTSEMKIVAVPDRQSLYTGAVIGSNSAGAALPVSTANVVTTVFNAWSGVALADADQGMALFYVAACGSNPGWNGGTIYYSTDSGVSWNQVGACQTPATFGVTSSVLSSAGAVADTFDNTNTVNVDMSLSRGGLATTTDALIEIFDNVLVVGQEILGLGVATLTAPDLYTLSHLYRGERSSVMTGHASPEQVVLYTPDVIRIAVPAGLVGTTIQVKVVSNYETLAGVTAQNVIIAPITPTALATTVGGLTTTVGGLSSAIGGIVVPTFLATAQSFTPAFDGAWHTISPSGLPSAATMLIVDGFFENSGGGSPNLDNVDLMFNLRQSSAATLTLKAAQNRGVNGNYTGQQAFQVMVPCTGTQTFDYEIGGSNTSATLSGELRVIGYWAPP